MRGEFHVDMVRADFLKAAAHDPMGQFRAIALAAQVAEIQMPQLCGHDLFGGSGSVFVGQVAVAAQDALFKTPRSAHAILQHLYVVIGFEHERIGWADAFNDKPGHVTEVGDESDVRAVGAEQKAHGVLRVVRDGEGIHDNVAHLEVAAGREKPIIESSVKRVGNRFLGRAVAVDGDSQFVGKAGQALDVIGVLVGDENPVQALGRAANRGQPLPDLADTETRVNEDAGFLGLHVGAVASGTAAQDRQFDTHGRTVVMGLAGGNVFPLVMVSAEQSELAFGG